MVILNDNDMFKSADGSVSFQPLYSDLRRLKQMTPYHGSGFWPETSYIYICIPQKGYAGQDHFIGRNINKADSNCNYKSLLLSH